jgi:hypothetical protein
MDHRIQLCLIASARMEILIGHARIGTDAFLACTMARLHETDLASTDAGDAPERGPGRVLRQSRSYLSCGSQRLTHVKWTPE